MPAPTTNAVSPLLTEVLAYRPGPELADWFANWQSRLQAELSQSTSLTQRKQPKQAKAADCGTAGALLAIVRRVMRAIDTRHTVPVLACVRLTVVGGCAVMVATNLEQAITETFSFPVPDFDAVVNGKALVAALRAMPATEVLSISKADDTEKDGEGGLTINRSVLQCLLPSNFPSNNPGNMPWGFDIKADELCALLEPIVPAVSNEEARYYLNGICLQVEGDKLTFTATDGHRLVVRQIAKPASLPDKLSIIVPRSVIVDALALFGKSTETVQVSFSDTWVRFERGNLSEVAKLIDGKFPEFRRVIPCENPHRFTIDASDLIKAVSAVKGLGGSRNRSIPCKLDIADGKLTVSGSDAETGTTSCEVPVTLSSDFEISIGFQGRYLLDILNHATKRVTFALGDSGAPAVITDDIKDKLTVLIPVRT